ncbi:MAG TPA: DUF5680 domain-containing protein [Ktedonobacteraceae bacterium]|nr:DUF5680 domain-containing protein [Ktedonobacteraceae bacterium]
MAFIDSEFREFLLNAKKNTYASEEENGQSVESLPGSTQHEYREGDFLYQDLYVGSAYFVGQETVLYQGTPIWSMSYAGGTSPALHRQEEVSAIYRFLRSALRNVEAERPYRGPSLFHDESYVYADESYGNIDSFWGYEAITNPDGVVYALRYNGGFLR